MSDTILVIETRLRTNAPAHKVDGVIETFEQEVRLQFGSMIEHVEVVDRKVLYTDTEIRRDLDERPQPWALEGRAQVYYSDPKPKRGLLVDFFSVIREFVR